MFETDQITLEIEQLKGLNCLDQTKHHATELIERLIKQASQTVHFQKTKIDALSLELARLKNWRFGRSSESMDAAQGESNLRYAAKAMRSNASEKKSASNSIASLLNFLYTVTFVASTVV